MTKYFRALRVYHNLNYNLYLVNEDQRSKHHLDKVAYETSLDP